MFFFFFFFFVFFFQAEDGIRDWSVTGVQTCALPILKRIASVRSLCSAKVTVRIAAMPHPAKATVACKPDLWRDITGKDRSPIATQRQPATNNVSSTKPFTTSHPSGTLKSKDRKSVV